MNEWRSVTLGKVATLQRGFDLPHRVRRHGQIPIVSSAGVTDYHDTPMVKPPGVVTGRYGTIGELFYVDEPFWPLNTTLYVRDFHDNDPLFVYYHLQQFDFDAFSGKSGVPGVNRNDLHAETVSLPTDIQEQRAIATALRDVDSLLKGLDRLISKKRDLKQAALQQLLTGQTRLHGFNDKWEVKRLGELGKCLRGVSYDGASDLANSDTAETKRLLRSNNVQNSVVLTKDVQFVNAARVSDLQLLKDGDVLICMANGSKALVGKAGIFNVSDGYEYTFGAFMGCFRTNPSEAHPSFVFFLFLTGKYREYINNLLAGSSINNLRPSSIESLEFPIPSVPEQAAIADVLTETDAELAMFEQRREKVRSIKEGMMQQLLTGKVRLV